MKALPAALALTGAATLVLLGAAPAHAAGNSIDPGDDLYSINCDIQYPDWQLFSVESSTAFSTPIGDGDGGPSDTACAAQPAWNPATGVSYYIQWQLEDDITSLATIDPATGESVVIADLFEIQGEFIVEQFITSIAIGADGAAYAIGADGYLYSLNLATAELTSIAPTGYTEVYAFAYDAVTATFYFIQFAGELHSLDVSTGFAQSLGAYPTDATVVSLQFDEAGTWWVMIYDHDVALDDDTAQLASFTLPTLATPVVSGTFTDDPYYTQAILIIPGTEPALAATGSTASGVVVATGVAGILALIGAGLVIARGRRTA